MEGLNLREIVLRHPPAAGEYTPSEVLPTYSNTGGSGAIVVSGIEGQDGGRGGIVLVDNLGSSGNGWPWDGNTKLPYTATFATPLTFTKCQIAFSVANRNASKPTAGTWTLYYLDSLNNATVFATADSTAESTAQLILSKTWDFSALYPNVHQINGFKLTFTGTANEVNWCIAVGWLK